MGKQVAKTTHRFAVDDYVMVSLPNGYTTTGRIVRRFKNGGYGVEEQSNGGSRYHTRAERFLSPLAKSKPKKKPEAEQRPDPTAPTAATPSPIPTTPTVKPTAATAEAVSIRPSSPASSVLAGRSLRPTTTAAPHVVIIARAGTGKTTTLVEGLKLLRGQEPRITPSEQQRAIWDAIAQSRDRCRFVCLTAFNVKIAEELSQRVPEGVDVKTVHGLGAKAVRKAFGNVEVDNRRVRTKALIARVTGRDIAEIAKEQPRLIPLVDELVSKAKMNLTGLDALRRRGECDWDRELDLLADRYGLEFGDRYEEDREASERLRRAVYDLVPAILGETLNLADKRITFDDQIWLPVVLELPAFRFDLLMVDEAQDLNRCQQALVKRMGDRLILCGDDRQAIYGFAGADSESMDRMLRELGYNGLNEIRPHPVFPKNARGCIKLPLTVTRRCGKRIVEVAQQFVSDFSAHESNPEGIVRNAAYWKDAKGKLIDESKSYLAEVRETDMILSRANAPLISNCLKLLKRGVRAFVAGRDVGDGIVSLITGMEATTVPDLVARLGEWAQREIARLSAGDEPDEVKIEAVTDRRDCALAFTEEAESVEQVIRRVDTLFSDSERPGVKLSSIHRAKGLEARRVFVLQPGGPRRRRQTEQDWQWQQEQNLRYVAATRAIEELVFVS